MADTPVQPDPKGHSLTAPLTAPASHPPVIPPPQAVVSTNAPGLAIIMMIGVSFIFALQDAVSRHLGERYPPILFVMLRYWFFAVFVMVLASRQSGGIKRAMASKRPKTQILRGVLLVCEVVIVIEAFVRLGLIATHAIFASYPLIIAALSGPLLGEKVGWRRWTAIAAGFVGILVILQPGAQAFSLNSLFAVASAVLFAIYGLLTRHVARDDPSGVSFFWTGMSGVFAATAVGIWYLEPIAREDWIWLVVISITAAAAHYLLIRAYELAEASALQPFAYFQLLFIAVLGVWIFNETIAPHVIAGGAIVVGAGLFTLARARERDQR